MHQLRALTRGKNLEIRKLITYKARLLGMQVVLQNEKDTSKTCPNCGHIVKRGLSTTGHVGIYASEDLPSWAVGVNLLSSGESLNEESPQAKLWGVSSRKSTRQTRK